MPEGLESHRPLKGIPRPTRIQRNEAGRVEVIFDRSPIPGEEGIDVGTHVPFPERVAHGVGIGIERIVERAHENLAVQLGRCASGNTTRDRQQYGIGKVRGCFCPFHPEGAREGHPFIEMRPAQ